jgi:sugar phosphate isomerase/epimerase
MDNNIERFYSAVDDAEDAVRNMFAALSAAGVDLAESNLARRIRSIDSTLGEIREEVEDTGLEP